MKTNINSFYEISCESGCCPACGSEVFYAPLSANTSEATCLCGRLLLRYEGGSREGTVEIIAPRRFRPAFPRRATVM